MTCTCSDVIVFLSQARRVIVYLGRAKPEQLADEMMNELRTIEPLTHSVERTHTPPYFRLCVRRAQNNSDDDADSHDGATSALTEHTEVTSLHESLPGSKPSSTAGSITSAHRLRLSQECPDKLATPTPINDR